MAFVKCKKCKFLVKDRCKKSAPGQVSVEVRSLDTDVDGEFIVPRFYAFSPLKLNDDGCYEGESW